MKKFFYATTTEIPDDGWGFIRQTPFVDRLELKPAFTSKRELIVSSEANPWQSLGGQTLPKGTVMVACWTEREPGTIQHEGSESFFIGDLLTEVLVSGGTCGSHIVLSNGWALQVSSYQLEFVKTIRPEMVGLTSWVRPLPKVPVYHGKAYPVSFR